MAKRKPKRKPVSSRVETRFLGESGEVVHTANYNEGLIVTSDGVEIFKQAENSALTTGEVYNPSMSSGSKPIMMVGVCEFCRQAKPRFPWQKKRRTHGMANARKLKLCCDCGQAICPRHRQRSRYDRQWRCPPCHKRHTWLLRLRQIFFERVEA